MILGSIESQKSNFLFVLFYEVRVLCLLTSLLLLPHKISDIILSYTFIIFCFVLLILLSNLIGLYFTQIRFSLISI